MHYLSLFAATFFSRLWDANFWYAFPLIIAISLVYSATRHEDMDEILSHALRIGLWIVFVMAALFAVLWGISSRL